MINSTIRNENNIQIPYKTFKRRVNDTDGTMFLYILLKVTQISFCLLSRSECEVFVFLS